MKKIGLLMVLGVFLMALGSCSKDDDDFDIVGSWQQVRSDVVISFGVPGVPEMTLSDDDPVTVNFNANGTGSFVDEDGSEPFNWSLSGNKLTLSIDGISQEFTLTTMKSDRVVAETELTQQDFLAFFDDDDDEDDFDFSLFPNLKAKVVFEMVR